MIAVNHEPYERKFALHNVKFELRDDVPLDSMQKRENVQVRRHSEIAPRPQVERYAIAMKAGQDFPPITLWGSVILDGNTRIAAARLNGLTGLPAYIVQCRNERQAIILGAALNQMNGRNLTEQEAAEAAEEMMADGMADEYIAREVQVSAAKVRRWRLERTAVDRATRVGLGAEIDALSAARKQKLAPITHEEPFKALVNALAEHNPSGPQFAEVIEQVTTASSDEVAVRVVQEAVESWEPAGIHRAGQAGTVTARKANAPIGSLLKHDPAYYVDLNVADTQIPKWEQLHTLAVQVLDEYRRLRQIAS